jgi:hypothetical protein
MMIDPIISPRTRTIQAAAAAASRYWLGWARQPALWSCHEH